MAVTQQAAVAERHEPVSSSSRFGTDETSGEGPAETRIARLIHAAVRTIESNEMQPRLTDLARAADLSPSRFQRSFKRIIGLSPTQYGIALRRARLREALDVSRSVTEAIFAAGFGSSSQAYATLRAEAGLAPSLVRAGGRGVVVGHVGVPIARRRLHIGFTTRGLCHLSISGADVDTRAELQRLLPAATLMPLIDAGTRASVHAALEPIRAELGEAVGARERALIELLRKRLALLRPAFPTSLIKPERRTPRRTVERRAQ